MMWLPNNPTQFAIVIFLTISRYLLGYNQKRSPLPVCQITNKKPNTIQSFEKREVITRLTSFFVPFGLIPAVSKASTLAPPILGVDKSGLLNDCPNTPLTGCVSSQDDRPLCFLAPWSYDGSWQNARRRLLNNLRTKKGARFVSPLDPSAYSNDEINDDGDESGRYIRIEFFDKATGVIDDTEFYFTPGDCTIQYRSMRREGIDVLNQNRNRIESIRIALGFENIPVLRNRRRTLLFMESPLDEFGPPTIMFDKVVDNVSGDMSFNQGVVGDLDHMAPVWEVPMSSVTIRKAESY